MEGHVTYNVVMAQYVVAVSGGVDSVVLLDLLASGNHEITVAHVDHGIRPDSAADARFVEGLARRYGHRFECVRLELGARASEELARHKRYEFLYDVASRQKAMIVTAHHADDLAETIAINLRRGTGWRGLAVLARPGIERPLLAYSKEQIYSYAIDHRLEWVEDSTNSDTKYLRNALRATLRPRITDQARLTLKDLRDQQLVLKQQIAKETDELLHKQQTARHFFTHIPAAVAVELLGSLIYQQTGIRPVYSQIERALLAIKTAKPHSECHVGNKVALRFTTRFFSVEML